MKRFWLLISLLFVCAAAAVGQTTGPAISLAPTTWAIRDPVTNNWKLVTAEKSPGAPTATLAGAGAGSVDNGTHQYRVELVTAVGHTNGGTVSSTVTVVDKTVNGKVSLISIPTGSVFVTSRKIYRTAAGAGAFLLLTTIADNTTTTFTDNVADSSLTTAMPTNNSTANPVLTYTGSTGAISIAGAAAGTVTSVSASGGTETTTGSAITTTGTIRGAQTVRNSSGLTVTVLDSDRGKVLKVTNAGGPDIVIAQAGTAGAFAAGWYCDILVTGAGGAILASTVSTIDGAANFAFSQNQTVRIVSDGTNYVTTLRGGGLTGSGSINTLAKFTAAGVVGDSHVMDDVDVTINPAERFSVTTSVDNASAISLNGAFGFLTIGGSTDRTASLGANSSNKIDLDGVAGTIVNTAATSIANTAPVQTNTASTGFSVVSPLFGVGSDGAKFQIGGGGHQGTISQYRAGVPTDGKLLIGDTANGEYTPAVLTPGTGISITNGAGSITVAVDSTVSTSTNTPLSSSLATNGTNATTTFATTGLSVSVVNGSIYEFTMILFVSDSVAAEGVKVDFNGGSATASNFRAHITSFDTALNLSSQVTSLSTSTSMGTFTGAGMIEVHGTITASADGTFIPRYAQASHAVGTLTIFAGSNLILRKVG